jgi:hypothetical protein
MISNAYNLLGLNVESAPLTTHMHLYLNYKHKHTIKKKLPKKECTWNKKKIEWAKIPIENKKFKLGPFLKNLTSQWTYYYFQLQ